MENKIYESKLVEVTNRNNGITSYSLTNGTLRIFNLNETKKIDLEELKELNSMPGGEYLLQNYLVIKDKPALEALGIEPEPEYFYTSQQLEDLLMNGSCDQLEDCLNFAPDGTIELIKDIAVRLELPDTRKRALILEKTGFSIDNALNVKKIMATDEDETQKEQTKIRKAEPLKVETTEQKPERKVKEYKVVK